jgi:hypothetical protein
MQQCRVISNLSYEKPKSCRPLDSKVLIVTLNNGYQALLEPLKNTNSYACMCYRFHLFEFSPLLTFFISFCPTQGHPFEVSGTHSDNCLQHGFKVLQQKVPPSQMLPDLYMPFSSIAQISFVFITPQHQPLISSILLLELHIYFVKSLAQ